MKQKRILMSFRTDGNAGVSGVDEIHDNYRNRFSSATAPGFSRFTSVVGILIVIIREWFLWPIRPFVLRFRLKSSTIPEARKKATKVLLELIWHERRLLFYSHIESLLLNVKFAHWIFSILFMTLAIVHIAIEILRANN